MRKKYPKWRTIYYKAKDRCVNKNNTKFERYGGRGIKFLLTVKEMELLWERDKGYLLNSASVDRIDNDGNYEFSNCRFIEKSENTAKGRIKKVNRISKDGSYKTFNSYKEAYESLGIYNRPNAGEISNCVNGRKETYKGYKWEASV